MVVYPSAYRYSEEAQGFNCLLEIDIGSWFVSDLCDRFYPLGKDQGLLQLLQTFNSSIKSVDTEVQQYVVDYKGTTRRLGFSRLSTSERLFVVCYMAHETKTRIIVCEELAQLDMPHMRMFFELWRHSPYINVILPHDLNGYTIRRLYELGVGE